MASFLRLRGDEYISLEYKPRKSRWFEFEIDADGPVKSYVLGPKNLRRYEEGKKFRYVGGFPDAKEVHYQKLWIRFSGPVYLIIENPDPHKTADVTYEVHY